MSYEFITYKKTGSEVFAIPSYSIQGFKDLPVEHSQGNERHYDYHALFVWE